MKKLLLPLFVFSLFTAVRAQLVVTSGVTSAQLVNGFIGPGLSVSNINLNCASGAYGTFSNGNTTNLGITNGSIFTSGSAVGAIGPDNTGSYSVSNGTNTSDPDLTTIEPQATKDPCILTFDVIPSCSVLTIRFVFGSEEYPEFVNAGFNDAFGFFITGPNPSGPAYAGYNVARLPNSTPVSIDNVNAGLNSGYYVNNAGGATIQYDGITTVITSNLAVTPCQTYTFKIAIADAGDYIYDSGVFIDLLTCSTAIVSTVSSTPSCGCTGTATVNASGGQPAYTYVWNTSPVQNTQTATGLCPGNYVVTVYDQNGCVSNSNSSNVTVNSAPGPSVTTSSTPAGCNVSNGSATANASGGTAPYTYSWSPSGGNAQTANNLAAGTYVITITDANGCTVQTSVVVAGSNAPTATASSTPAGCSVSNGSATVNPSGGTPAYTYAWSPSGGNAQTANNLSPGTYVVTVTDANGCSVQTSVVVGGSNAPTAMASSTPAGCNMANGTATANPSGGTAPYTYSWNTAPVQNTQTANNLPSGTYVVTVTDANGCSVQTSVVVGGTNAPTVTASATSAGCSMANGTATANPSGGTAPYTYAWNTAPVQNTQTATGLSGGVYTIIVTDANGCSVTTTINVASTTAPTTAAVSTNAKCGLNNGSATATPSGGTPAYTYAWSPSGGNAQTANNLGAGTYTILVTDASGCTASATVSITASSSPTVTATSSSTISCNGGKNASASAAVTGGTASFTYQWNTTPPQNTSTATGLGAGTYIVIVTDANGCTSQSSIVISQPQILAATASQINLKCNGVKNGSAAVALTGGTSPYTYAWNTVPPQNTQTASGLAAGTYSVLVTDNHGCTATQLVTITQPQPVTLGIACGDSVCFGKSTTLSATVTGGTPSYTYVWLPGPKSGSAISVSPTSNTSYSVTVTDANGCTSGNSQNCTVIVLPSPNANFDTISQGNLSSMYAFLDSSSGGSSWSWNFGDPTSTSNSSTQQNPVHTFSGAGTYTVTQIVFNKFGCPDTFKTIVIIHEGILIPNVFTPDADGFNDVWYIPNSGMKEFHVEIYNRWGEKVFETTADEIRWDGHSTSGKMLNDGTYYYVLRAVLKSGSKGKDYSRTGYVTLLTKK